MINLTVFGQSHYLGLKSGVSWCDQSGNFFKNTATIQRMLLGLNYGYKFNNDLKISGDLLFSQTGFKSPMTLTDEYGNPTAQDPVYTKFFYDYLSIPLKVGYEYGKNGFVYGNIGFTTSFLLNAKTTTPIINEKLEEVGRNQFDVTKKVAPIEFGGEIEIGFGYTFLRKIGVYIEGNFHHGFTTISTKQYFPENTIFNYKASVILGLRYQFAP